MAGKDSGVRWNGETVEGVLHLRSRGLSIYRIAALWRRTVLWYCTLVESLHFVSFSKVAVELTTSMKKRRRRSLMASGWQSVSVRAVRMSVWLVEPGGWNDQQYLPIRQ